MPETRPSPRDLHAGATLAFWCVVGAAAALLVAYLAFKKPGSGAPGGFGPAGVGGLVPAPSRKDLPDFHLKLYDGERTIVKKDFRGKVAVLHIWATWCPPCRAEFPEFAKFAKEAGPEVAVIALSVDGSPAEVASFARGNPGMPPVFMDPQSTYMAELGTRSIPETIVVDPLGRIAFRAAGAQDWGSGGIPKLVETLRKEGG